MRGVFGRAERFPGLFFPAAAIDDGAVGTGWAN